MALSAKVSTDRTALEVTFAGMASSSSYPALYLRDNCPLSWHPTTLQRTVAIWDLPGDLAISSSDVLEQGQVVRVTFSDGYISHFSEQWLSEHRLDEAARLERHCQHAAELVPWVKADFPGGNVPSFEFSKIMSDEAHLLDFLDAIATLGLVRVRGMGRTVGKIEKLAKRVGHLRETNYGRLFEVKFDPQAINQAYTDAALPLHTDLPYYQLPPGVQVLHCIEQSMGSPGTGRSLFVDGLAVAHRLQKVSPRYYKILTECPAVFEDVAHGKFHLRTERCIIKQFEPSPFLFEQRSGGRSGKGVAVEINYNNGVRSAELNLPPSIVHEFYRAMALFGKIAHSPEMCIDTKLHPGDAFVFQNRRVLHGRTKLNTVGQSGGASPRHLQGGYIDLDAIHSCRRLLRKQMGEKRGVTINANFMSPISRNSKL